MAGTDPDVVQPEPPVTVDMVAQVVTRLLAKSDKAVRYRGMPGRDGADGKDGINGINGADGLHGKDGRDGANGRDGRNGDPGLDGINGTNGTPGRQGLQGLRGAPGVDGTNGTNGRDAAGIPGKDGRNGVDGAPGRNGTNGVPGKDGVNGADVLELYRKRFGPSSFDDVLRYIAELAVPLVLKTLDAERVRLASAKIADTRTPTAEKPADPVAEARP